jgi:hypothetical protein
MTIAVTHTATLVGPVDEAPLANPRARKMMSRAAYLAARCLAALVGQTGWSDRERIGYFLGVGASGGSLTDVSELLERGVAACNPLLAFQLMNNFTMCHGAILEGLGGPNAALFSRGAGTIAALAEAMHAIESGDCEHAITGGADEATHPVTVAELTREGFIGRGLVPADGAGLLALAHSDDRDATIIEGCAHASGRGRPLVEALDDALARASASSAPGDRGVRASAPPSVTSIVISAWGPSAAGALRSFATERFPSATVIDTSGQRECLAAGPALAVATAVEHLRGARGRAVVLSLGVDGDPGVVVLSRGAA